MVICMCTKSNTAKASTVMPAGSAASFSWSAACIKLWSTVAAVLIFLVRSCLIADVAQAGFLVSLIPAVNAVPVKWPKLMAL